MTNRNAPTIESPVTGQAQAIPASNGKPPTPTAVEGVTPTTHPPHCRPERGDLLAMQRAALAYAQRGWPVFPVHSPIWHGDKVVGCTCERYRRSDKARNKPHGLAANGKCETPGKCPAFCSPKDATTDEDQIMNWWRNAKKEIDVETGKEVYFVPNIGINAGAAGLVVFDLDSYKEKFGADQVDSILTIADRETVTVISGGGGEHLFYKMPEGKRYTCKKEDLPEGIDIKADGGYVVAVPSMHKSGRRYQWEEGYSPDDMEPATLPAGLQNILDQMGRNGTTPGVTFTAATTTERPELDQWNLSSKIVDLINAAPVKGQRSESDQSVANALIRAGATDGDILAVFQHYPIGTQGKFAGAGWQYLARTIENGKAYLSKQGNNEAESHPTTTTRSTGPYEIDSGRLCLVTEGDKETHYLPIADFTAKITERIVSEGGEIAYKIQGVALRGGAFTCEIGASDFEDTRKLKAALGAAAGAMDTIYAGKAEHLCPAIKAFTTDVTESQRFDRVGWHEGSFLLPGREEAGVSISLTRKLPYRVEQDADLDKGMKALQSLIEFMGSEKAAVLLSFILQAPLAHPADWRNERYCLFVKGRSGTYKTSTTQLAMSIYGAAFQRDESLIKFGEGATRNAIMQYATKSSDLPMLIDNFKPSTGDGEHGFTNLIHNILEGGEKERLNKASQLRESKPIFTWPLCTGEDLPTRDPASLARCLVISMPNLQDRDMTQLSAAQDLGDHLNAIGRVWLEWLEGDDGRRVASETGALLNKQRAVFASILKKTGHAMVNPGRIATNLATNQLTLLAAQSHPTLGEIARQYIGSHQTGLIDIAHTMAGVTAESLEAHRFINLLQELIGSGQGYLIPDKTTAAESVADPNNRNRVIGWSDGAGGAYLLPNKAIEAAKRLSGDDLGDVSSETLYQQLTEIGLIKSRSKGTNLVTVRAGGKPMRALHLGAAALGGADL